MTMATTPGEAEGPSGITVTPEVRPNGGLPLTPDKRRFVSAHRAAALKKVTPSSIYLWLAKGYLQGMKVTVGPKGIWYVDRASLDAFTPFRKSKTGAKAKPTPVHARPFRVRPSVRQPGVGRGKYDRALARPRTTKATPAPSPSTGKRINAGGGGGGQSALIREIKVLTGAIRDLRSALKTLR
jgi:hypothetical protein